MVPISLLELLLIEHLQIRILPPEAIDHNINRLILRLNPHPVGHLLDIVKLPVPRLQPPRQLIAFFRQLPLTNGRLPQILPQLVLQQLGPRFLVGHLFEDTGVRGAVGLRLLLLDGWGLGGV